MVADDARLEQHRATAIASCGSTRLGERRLPLPNWRIAVRAKLRSAPPHPSCGHLLPRGGEGWVEGDGVARWWPSAKTRSHRRTSRAGMEIAKKFGLEILPPPHA